MQRSYLYLIGITLLALSCSKKDSGYVNNPGISSSLHNRSVGASSNELLAANKYTSLKIEVQYMTGFAPDAPALAHLQSILASLVNKPAGITIVTKEIPASTNTSLSLNQVIDIEKNNRTVFTNGTELGVYVLYTNGAYSDPIVLGIAYNNTSVDFFVKKIRDNSGAIGQASRTKLVATVAEHEMGHLLGLVDLGSNMQVAHKDAAHGSHCSNTNCLMYYASETTDILGFLITGNIPSFDANCKADLTATGGK
jgi:hypothetical protein